MLLSSLLSFTTWMKENLILFWGIVGAVAVALVLTVSFLIIRRRTTKRKSKSTTVQEVLAKTGTKIETNPETAPVEIAWKLEPVQPKKPVAKKTVQPAAESAIVPEKQNIKEESSVPIKEPAAENTPVVAENVIEEVSAVSEENVTENSSVLTEKPFAEEIEVPAVEPVKEETTKKETVAVKVVSQPAFNFITVRYDRSFEARVIQLDETSKDFYSQIKNEILSYPKVKSRMSWRHETYRLGRVTVAKMQCRGRTLCLYLAIDPALLADTKYLVENVGDVKKNANTPCLYRIKNERRCRYSKQLIEQMFAAMGIGKADEQNVDYKVPYEPLNDLLARGLVKRIEVKSNVFGEPAPVALDEEDDDIIEVIRVPVDDSEETEEILQEEEIGTQEEIEEPIAELISEEQEEPIPEQEPVAEEEHIEVSATAAREAMEDEVAIASVTESGEVSDKSNPVVVNVDTLSKYFRNGDRVTLKEMKESIPFVSNRATYVKVLARGRINKSLEVEADDFSLDAVKMIVLAGGKVIRKRTN